MKRTDMNMKRADMKKIFCAILILAFIISANPVFAAADNTAAGAAEKAGGGEAFGQAESIAVGAEPQESGSEPQFPGTGSLPDENRDYTVAELQEIALKNSRQALADDMDIKKKEMAVRTVRSDANAMSDSILSVTRPMEVKLELEAAQKTKQDNLEKLKVDVYKAALNILLCKAEIEMLEKKLAMAGERLQMARARFDASMVTRDELDSAQYNVDRCEVDLNNAKEKLNSLYMEMRRLLNLPLNSRPVKISGEIKKESFEDIDIDYALYHLYKRETSVYKAAGKLEIAKTAMGIAADLYREGDLYYDKAALDLEEAEFDLAAAKTALEVKVRNTYNDMINKLDNVELAGKFADLTAKKLENAKVKYEKGAISKNDYMKAQEELLDARFSELSAIVDFDAVKAEFFNLINAGEQFN